MKKFILPLLFSVLYLSFLPAYEIDHVTFVPREFFVGDVVDIRITLKLGQGTFLTVPEELPVSDWVFLRDLEIQENEGTTTVHIIFTPFQPGIRVLPPIDLEGIVLEGVKVDTVSFLEREYSPFLPAADPMYLPKTGFYFALIVGCVIGLPLIILFFFKGIRTRIRRAVTAAGRKRPYTRLQKVIRELERKILNRDGNVFYTILLSELKIYMTARTGTEFATLTGREACMVLDNLYPEEYFKGTLEELFLYSDQVKFGGLDPYTARKKEDLNRLDETAKALEIYYRHVWAAEEREGAADVDR